MAIELKGLTKRSENYTLRPVCPLSLWFPQKRCPIRANVNSLYQFIAKTTEMMMNNAARIFVIFSRVPSIERPLFLPQ